MLNKNPLARAHYKHHNNPRSYEFHLIIYIQEPLRLQKCADHYEQLAKPQSLINFAPCPHTSRYSAGCTPFSDFSFLIHSVVSVSLGPLTRPSIQSKTEFTETHTPYIKFSGNSKCEQRSQGCQCLAPQIEIPFTADPAPTQTTICRSNSGPLLLPSLQPANDILPTHPDN